jgi:hypothetical protein
VSASDGFELVPDPPEISSQTAARRETAGVYLHTLEHYAKEFGRSVRCVKGWKALGRKVGDLPPFDDLAAMAEWWERMKSAGHLKWKVPDIFVFAAAGEGAPPKEKPAAPPRDESKAVQSAVSNAESAELGFAAALGRVQAAERLAHSRWQEELQKKGEDFNPMREKQRAESWERTAEKLANLESKAEKILGREFVQMEEVERVVADRETALRDSLRSMPTRIATKLNLPTDLFAQVVEAGHVELDKVFENLETAPGEMFELDA